jgi:hypothetical protein
MISANRFDEMVAREGDAGCPSRCCANSDHAMSLTS